MAENCKNFSPKFAYISGASRGIGRGIAYSLAKEGYNLSLVCRSNTELLEDAAEQIRKEYGVEVITHTGNVGDSDFVKKVVKNTMDVFPRMDAVINNAGISHIGLLSDMEEKDWKELMDVNLSSIFYTVKAFLPYLISEKSGSIINISSMWGQVGAACETAYSASKGAVDAFTKALAKELAPSNINVNALSLGLMDTDMNKCFSEEELAEIIGEIPARRMGRPREAGQAVLSILNSPAYLTGQIIRMDGGYI